MNPIQILIVDDNLTHFHIVDFYLSNRKNLVTSFARTGQDALDILHKHPADFFNCIIYSDDHSIKDRFTLLQKIRQYTERDKIPIILQKLRRTSINDVPYPSDTFFFLQKPLEYGLLNAVVTTALRELETYRSLASNSESNHHDDSTLLLVKDAQFKIKTPTEAKQLSSYIGGFSSQPTDTAMGVFELLLNAIEHGNLGITYEEKSKLLDAGDFQYEVTKRLKKAPYADKEVNVKFHRSDSKMSIEITDMGDGFDFSQYATLSEDRMYDSHGRGIIMAHHIFPDAVTYTHGGRTVTCTSNQMLKYPIKKT